MSNDRQLVPIVRETMKIDTREQAIDMQAIENRRFLYQPSTHTLVLGRQHGKTAGLPGSHAVELAEAGITKDFDDFVRGWVGTGRGYPHGVIHFAPAVDKQCVALFEKAFDTLEMFSANGARDQTLIRGFGDVWELPLASILYPDRETERKPSLRAQLKDQKVQERAPRTKAEKQPER